MPHRHASLDPARRQFIAVALFTVFINILFQVLLSLLPPATLHPVVRALAETIAVAAFAVPLAYYFYMRPLYLSLAERQAAQEELGRSEMHHRIVSELTTTFVFDLLVAEDGTVSLDFLSDSFSAFSGRSKEDVGSLESLLLHIHPDDRAGLTENLRRLVSRPQSAEIECRAYIGSPHTLRWLALCGRSEMSREQGRVTVIYGAVTDITHRKLAEEARTESNARFQRLADSIQGFIAYVNADTLRYEFVNETYAKSFGVSREKIIGSTVKEILGDAKFQFALPYIDEVRSGKSTSYENTFDFVTGKRWVRVSFSPVFGANGLVESIAVLNHDITERKQAEEAQARTKRLLEISQRLAHIGSWEYELSTGTLSWSDEMYRIAGLPVGAPVSPEIAGSFFPPDERARSQKVITSLIERHTAYSAEYRIVRHDGQARVIRNEGEMVLDEDGKAVRALGTMQDITDRKRAEAGLRESEEKFRSIVEQSADGVIVTKEDGTIVEWNTAEELLTGVKKMDVVGLPIWEVQSALVPKDRRPPELLARDQAAIEKFLHGEMSPAGEKQERRILLADGTSKVVLESVFLVRQGDTNMGVSIHSDITERKKAENDRLIAEQYLQQARKLESLGMLAGGIAHDFNNMLTGVYGFMDLARSRVTDEAASDYLSQAAESIDRARGLTQQLLTFSKGGEPIKKLIPIASLIRETCSFALSGANVKCRYSLPHDLRHCSVDRNQIGQVVQNVMLNAIQAMPMGGVIEVVAENVTLEEREDPLLAKGSYVLISIRDHGTGIAPDMLPRIFDPFFTTKTKGHGLGLATTYSIVKRHGGAIRVESELGKGSTFHIYLPAVSTSGPESIPAAKGTHTGTGRVLVMDDDVAIRKLISLMLESLGYSVLCVENGAATIDRFEEEERNGRPLSAVILDLTIPGGMGGKEAAEALRKLDGEIPIFVSSGYAEDPIMANPRAYGITASLSKPFKKTELMEMLEKHVRKR